MALLTQSGQIIRRIHVDWDSFRDLVRPLAEVEQKAIESALILCRGHQAEAARRLGISPCTLRAKMRKYRAGENCWADKPKYARAKAAAG